MTTIQDDLMKNIIEDYNSGLSPNKISEKYEEISPYQIRENLKRVGVFKTLYFTTEELEGIKLDFNLGLSLKQLVEKYNRPEETIRKKLQSFGLYNVRENVPYSDEELLILNQYYPIGDWDSLLKYLPNRDRGSISTKASKLGITRESWNWTKEKIERIMLEQSYTLMSEFTNIKNKHDVIDKDGYKYYVNLAGFAYNTYKPTRFSQDNIYTIDNIKHYIVLNDIDCELLSDKYINNTTDLEWRCHCGKHFACPWTRFQSGKHQCNECSNILINEKKTLSIDDVKELIKDRPYTMIDETFTKLSDGFSAITDEGYYVIVSRNNVCKNNNPEVFHKNNPYTIKNIQHYLKLNKIKTTLISQKYEGNNKRLKWRCGCGNEFERTWNGVLQGAFLCKDCSDVEKYKTQKEQEFVLVKEYFKNRNYQLLSTEYIGNRSKLKYICNSHKDKGVQEISWSHCKNRNAGCRYCAAEKNGILHRIPEEEIKSLTESKGFIYDHVEYSVNNNNKTLIYYLCPLHIDKGVQTKVLADMRKSTGQCTYCLGRERSHEDFIELMSDVNPNIIFLSKYQNSASEILCRCKIDGYEWYSNANRLMSGQGCPECGKRKQIENSTKSHEEFESEITSKYDGKIILLSKYTGSHDPIDCKCILHNTVWTTTATSLLTSSIGCPTCVGEATGDRCRKSNEQFLQELSEVNPHIIPLENYVHDHHKIKCRCSIHNYEWYASPNKILRRKTGCPKCASYHNENGIDEILDNWGYKYTAQKRFKDCKDKHTLPFDRYLDDFNILIEYDGEGHYIPIRRGSMTEQDAEENLKITQYHDKIKNEYCKKNKIPLIRIPYWENDNLEEFLFDNLVKYKAIEIVN